MQTVYLDEAIEEIMQNVINTLQQGTVEGGLLFGVDKVVDGDHTTGSQKGTSLWVFIESMPSSTDRGSIREEWSMNLQIVCLVKSNNPQEGQRLSTKYAARARSVLIKDKRLGLGYVQGIKSKDMNRNNSRFTHGNIYGASCGVTITFTTFEN